MMESKANDTGASPMTREDWQWLVSREAVPWLESAARDDRSLVALTKDLRKHLTAARAHMVLELVELRRRARAKFDDAAQMFFTRPGLEQATDQRIAAYKSERFPTGATIADLCCGIGGDLLGLATRTRVVGVDRDNVTRLLAEANARGCGTDRVRLRQADVKDVPVGDFAAWHLDPDRRPHGRRTTQVVLHDPTPDVIDRLLRECRHAAIKLAPAAQWPRHWTERAEFEWIGHRRQCQQLVVWFGRLARRPGLAVATILSPNSVRTLAGRPDRDIPYCRAPGRYVYEPQPPILAAGLTGTLAAEHDLAGFGPDVPYLTGDELVADDALSAFEVSDVLPLDMKRLRLLMRARRIGRLEVKKRGVRHDPDAVRRALRTDGAQEATLILTRIEGRATALVTRRTSPIATLPSTKRN